VSLILEALNRSQRDRQIETAPAGRDTAAYFEDSEARRSRLSWLPWLALIMALLVIGWLLLDRSGVQVVQVPPPSKNGSLLVQSGPAQKSLEKPARAGPLEPESAVVPAALGQIPKPRTANPPSVAASGIDIIETDPTDSAVAALYGETEEKTVAVKTPVSAKSKDASLQEKPIDIEEVLARTEEALKTASLLEHSAPFLSTLSQQVKNDIPTMFYSAHDYSSNSGQSSVVINGKTLRVGGSIAGGVKLDEILSDSIVLSHRGTQFRLRALNSWVNL
jgi:general secretion pathway protein B